jgi:hypothetical protein
VIEEEENKVTVLDEATGEEIVFEKAKFVILMVLH